MKPTLYFRRPERQKSAPTKSGLREIVKPLFRYRIQLLPLLVAYFTIMGSLILGSRAPYMISLILILLSMLVYFRGQWVKIPNTDSGDQIKIYVTLVLAVMALWSVVAIWGSDSGKPTLKWIVILLLGTYPMAFPWLRYNSRKNSVMVTFADDLPFKLRRAMAGKARTVVLGWDSLIGGSMMVGATLSTVHFDMWSVTLSVRLGHAKVAEDFTQLRLRRLESAFDAKRNSARVEDVPGRSARLARVRFMLADPLANPIIPTEEDVMGDEELSLHIGMFENGMRVIVDLIHTLIAGASGAGKSGFINALMRELVRKRNVAILGIDMKPGGLELGKWKDALFALAKSPLEARIMMENVMKGLHRRGAIMAERGWRNWKATPEEPFVVLVIDEVHQLKQHKLFPLLIALSELSRAYGFAIIMATQHPKDSSVPVEAIANCLQRIGLACSASTAERLVFDDNATREGWRLTLLPPNQEGTFLIRSKRYRRPMMARAHWISDVMVERISDEWSRFVTAIDDPTWKGAITAPNSTIEIEPSEPDDVIDAIIVENDPNELVMMAIVNGRGMLSEIVVTTGLPRSSVIAIIQRLSQDGRIVQDGRRKPWRAA